MRNEVEEDDDDFHDTMEMLAVDLMTSGMRIVGHRHLAALDLVQGRQPATQSEANAHLVAVRLKQSCATAMLTCLSRLQGLSGTLASQAGRQPDSALLSVPQTSNFLLLWSSAVLE